MGEDETQQQEMPDRTEFARMLASVKDAALSNLSLLSTQVWHHLGLMPLPGLDPSEVELEQARLAIDLYDANLKVLEGKLDDDTLKEHRRNLMNMQMNFVNKSRDESPKG